MSALIASLKTGIELLRRGDDDSYDKVSSRYSVAICIMFAALVSGGQYMGDPIHCWVPAEFTSQWVKYTDQYCWVKNTYYVAQGDKIPEHQHRSGLEIGYYQWTPMILAVQAMLFSLPTIMWKVLSSGAGYDIHHMVTLCNKAENVNPGKRDAIVAYLTNHLDKLLDYRQNYRSGIASSRLQALDKQCCVPGKRYGNYLFLLYLFIKLCHLTVALFQIFALSYVIGEGYHLYGVKVLTDMINGEGWEASPFFPRVTLCDFKMRRMGQNIHPYTVQCVLPFNLFNEKIYIFLWWWLVFVSVMAIIGFLVWMMTLLPNGNLRFVGKYLKVMNRLEKGNDKHRKLLREFTSLYLRQDGVFVLRMLARNVNDLTCGEIVCSLWDNFLAYRSKGYEETSSLH